jgi:hypothetical protein
MVVVVILPTTKISLAKPAMFTTAAVEFHDRFFFPCQHNKEQFLSFKSTHNDLQVYIWHCMPSAQEKSN